MTVGELTRRMGWAEFRAWQELERRRAAVRMPPEEARRRGLIDSEGRFT